MNALSRSWITGFVSLIAATTPGQGVINFYNNPATLVSTPLPQPVFWSPGDFYFGLLTAGTGGGPVNFTFNGLYATNLSVAGRFSGGSAVRVPGWPGGATETYAVAGWSASLGHDWNPAWLDGVFTTQGLFGISSLGTGLVGGGPGGLLPPLILFGGATGIPTGFVLNFVGPVPEPSVFTLVSLGAAALLCWRRTSDSRLRTRRQ